MYLPGATSDNLYVSNVVSPTSSQYAQVSQFDIFVPGTSGNLVCSKSSYLESATTPFTLTTATLAADFQFQPAPAHAVGVLAVEAIDVGVGLSKTVSADGADAVYANTGMLGLNGLKWCCVSHLE